MDFVVEKLKVLNAFLTTGIDVNKCTISNIYPLIIAIWLRCEDTVKLMLEKGGDVNIMDNYYDTPLTTALAFDLEEMVHVLLNANANVNHMGGEIRLPSIIANAGKPYTIIICCYYICFVVKYTKVVEKHK